METGRGGITLGEIIALLVVILLLGMFLPALQRPRECGGRRMTCRRNLRILGIAMVQYLDQKGDQFYYPWPAGGGDFDGGEWLAALYWSKVITEPEMLCCPSTVDDNEGGKELGAMDNLWVPPHAVSYAAKGRRVSPIGADGSPRCITDTMPGDTVMASDDTEGRRNHDAGLTVLFFDGHVEYLTGLDVQSAVGNDSPLDTICN